MPPVRVASATDRKYTGLDIREKQVAANKQTKRHLPRPPPQWFAMDAAEVARVQQGRELGVHQPFLLTEQSTGQMEGVDLGMLHAFGHALRLKQGCLGFLGKLLNGIHGKIESKKC